MTKRLEARRKGKKWSEYPVLSWLIVFQVSLILLGFVTLFIIFSLVSRTEHLALISQLRERVQPTLAEQSEKWIAWKLLGLTEALREEFSSARERLPIDTLEIVTGAELIDPIDPTTLIIANGSPSDPDALFVRATLAAPAYSKPLNAQNLMVVFLVTLMGMSLGVVGFSSLYIWRQIYRPLAKVNEGFRRLKTGRPLDMSGIAAKGEIEAFIQAIDEMNRNSVELESKVAVGELARQVAHDIRSPVAALVAIGESAQELSEENRSLLLSVAGRLDQIAESALCAGAWHRAMNEPADETEMTTRRLEADDNISIEAVLDLVSSMVLEKQRRFAGEAGVKIDLLAIGGYGLFANVNSSVFKRALSNILDNSVEACGATGEVKVGFQDLGRMVAIQVEDNGVGIPQDVLKRLGEKGVSYGKACGNGLGLYHAKKACEKWGGRLEIISTCGEGTKVNLILPKVGPPAWFVDAIYLEQNMKITVVDDDRSVLDVWKARMNDVVPSVADTELKCFATPMAFEEWFRGNAVGSGKQLVLMDYEFRGSEENGLDLIARLNLGGCSILVSGRSAEASLRKRCLKDNIPIIPKTLLPFVPIRAPKMV